LLLPPVGAVLDASPPPEEKYGQLSAPLPPLSPPLLETRSRGIQTPQPQSLEWRRGSPWMNRRRPGCFLGPLGLPGRVTKLGKGVGDHQEPPEGWLLAFVASSRSLSCTRFSLSSGHWSLSRGRCSLSHGHCSPSSECCSLSCRRQRILTRGFYGLGEAGPGLGSGSVA